MDDADPKLKAGLWGIEYHVWGTSARVSNEKLSRTGENQSPALDMHGHRMLYIKRGWRPHRVPPALIIIIGDLHLQKKIHTLSTPVTAALFWTFIRPINCKFIFYTLTNNSSGSTPLFLFLNAEISEAQNEIHLPIYSRILFHLYISKSSLLQ